MIVPEPKKGQDDIVFASAIYFESTNHKVEKLSQLNHQEQTELLYHMWREMEIIFGDVDNASTRMGKLLAWTQ